MVEHWKDSYPQSYKRMFPCYVYKEFTRRKVTGLDYEAGCTLYVAEQSTWCWCVQVGHDRWGRAHFAPKHEDKAKAFAVELLLKGLCFRINYRAPR
jgi:hypothetical protein